MSTPIAEYDDFDSPWKEALEQYFQEFTAFFFPQAFADIDWDKGYEFLDKELQQIARDAAVGQRHVDKLVKLWRLGGDETCFALSTGSCAYLRDWKMIFGRKCAITKRQ